MDRSNFNRAVKRLVERGVIEKGPKIGRMVSLRLNPEYGWKGSAKNHVACLDQERKEANGEGRDQGRDRGRPASPAGSPRARPGHAGHVHRVNPREAPTGCLRSNPRSEARAHLRKLRLQCSSQSQSQSLRAEGALSCFSKPREARADQERLRRPPGAFATWQAAGGRAPPATSPERWGRSWASRPSRCAVAARALTPIHSDSAPQAPARAGLWRVFSEGRVKGLVRPAAP